MTLPVVSLNWQLMNEKNEQDDDKVVEFAQLSLLLIMVGFVTLFVFPPLGFVLLMIGIFTFLMSLWRG